MIGIVGGVGPYAGIDLLKKIYDNTIAATDQEHLNTALISMSSSINDRTQYLNNKNLENPAYAIYKVLRKLENVGVTVAGIPCNTAHSPEIFNVVQDELKKDKSTLNLLNMIEETTSFIAVNYPQLKRIGVLSTTGTYKSGIYFDALRIKGYDIIVPTLEIQETNINPGIYDNEYGIKAFSNPVKAQAIENMHKGISYLKSQGAQAVILGCTEIPLAITQKEVDGLVTIDPTNVLARALIKNYSPKKLKHLNQ